jgi:asparagine synthase (glutamine-hydrolysing)
MCGITGIVNFDRQSVIDLAVLQKMTSSIIHRGPDDEGFYIDKNVGLGFRRLSIIDLSTGHQPLSDAAQKIRIVFNGEIYNYLELKDSLQRKGYYFLTNSDTEVIVNLYKEYGEDCVGHLRGMFAFAIYDSSNHKLFCARDRFGIKPFFYYLDHEKLIFGSEIKSVLQCPGIDKTLSPEGLESYFTYGYITSDLSAFRKIKKLPPSHTLSLDLTSPEKGILLKKYWELNLVQVYTGSLTSWTEELLASLEESVRIHMISDVPLGAFLSGGIDSSSVVAMMSKISDRPVKTFSIGFSENSFNELPFAREIARKYQTQHYEKIVDPVSIELLPLLVSSYDEPFADSSAIPTYLVSRHAREHVTVALSGDGGDELFAGYSSYLKLLNLTSKNIIPDSLSKILFGMIGKTWPEKWSGKGLLYYLSKEKNKIGAYYCLWKQEQRQLLYREGFKKTLQKPAEEFKINFLEKIKDVDFLTRLQYLDVRTYMVDDILTKVDRVSMQNSLEVRVPLLDHKFAELAFRIPSGLKLSKGDKKHVFKKAVSGLLTPNVLDHPKQGFGIPISAWFKDDLKNYMQEVLLDSGQPMFDFLEPKYVKKLVDNHLYGMRDMSSNIWSLLFFNEWLRQYAS